MKFVEKRPTYYERDTREMLNDAVKRINGNLERIWKKLDEIEKRLTNRLPLWATLLFSVLLGIIGWLVKSLIG